MAHDSFGHASGAWLFLWKKLVRDKASGSRGKKARCWTVVFLVSEAPHIWEAVGLEGIIR